MIPYGIIIISIEGGHFLFFMMGKQSGQIQMVILDIDSIIPADHLLRQIEIVLKCIRLGIVSGETSVADGSFLPSNVSWDSRYEAVETMNRSTMKMIKQRKDQ